MRKLLLLALFVSVIAVASSLPKNCRNGRCRPARPVRPGRANSPAKAPDNKLPTAPVRRPRPNRRPAPPVRKVPVTTALPTTTAAAPVTHPDMVTDADGQEVREDGVNGWMSSPTPAPDSNSSLDIARTEPPAKSEKPGSCDTPKGFGIKCMDRLDQCTTDHQCPGSTKCCMVGECGYMCVKPKPVSTETKEVTKQAPIKKNKVNKVGSQIAGDLATADSVISEAVELPEGALKPEDIIEMTEEMKDKMEEEKKKKKAETKNEEEEVVANQEAVAEENVEGEQAKTNEQKASKKTEKEEVALTETQEKVLEKIEKFVEKEVEEIVEELEPAVQVTPKEDVKKLNAE